MVDFYVLNLISIVLVANFLKHPKIFRILVLSASKVISRMIKKFVFLNQKRKFICSIKATSNKTLPSGHNAPKIFQEIYL